MSTIDEITELEERLRAAELGPDPAVFEELIADDAVLLEEDAKPSFAKKKVVDAHRPGAGPKFTRVEFQNANIVDHGTAAVVTCDGLYETGDATFTLRFMRVWHKSGNGWQVIAATVAQADES